MKPGTAVPGSKSDKAEPRRGGTPLATKSFRGDILEGISRHDLFS
jgi:hypothetical protein